MSAIQITGENFETQVLRSEKKVLLDFWAPWCGPCRMVSPILEEIAEESKTIILGKVNVDEEMALAVRFGVESIPTLVVMDQGRERARAVGYLPKENILRLLEK